MSRIAASDSAGNSQSKFAHITQTIPSKSEVELKRMLMQANESRIPTYHTSLAILHHLQNAKLHKPQLKLQHIQSILQHHKSQLTQIQVWDMQEQLFIAALDAQQGKLAEQQLLKISSQFDPKSSRVQRLRGLRLESQQRLDDADQIYADLLALDPCQPLVHKRRIAVLHAKFVASSSLKSTSSAAALIAALCDFLSKWPSDESALLLLVEIYTACSSHQLASVVCEELLLLCPDHHAYHSLYADCLAAARMDERAIKHYCTSITLCQHGNISALVGLIACIQHRVAQYPSKASTHTDCWNWAVQKLRNQVRASSPLALAQVEAAIGISTLSSDAVAQQAPLIKATKPVNATLTNQSQVAQSNNVTSAAVAQSAAPPVNPHSQQAGVQSLKSHADSVPNSPATASHNDSDREKENTAVLSDHAQSKPASSKGAAASTNQSTSIDALSHSVKQMSV